MTDERFSARAKREVFENAWFERIRLGKELGRLLVERGVIHPTMADHFVQELQFVAANLLRSAARK